jgi:2-amino-4-hydroxy-6-hydroxymethyldihydropteridine diphosphokinase
VIAAIALGSNLGDRHAHLDFAVSRLSQLLRPIVASAYRETEPVGVTGPQGFYLNGAAVGQTALPARALLDALMAIERERGRERPFPNAPRTLDLDLILLGDAMIDEPDLIVPHPRFRERRFVLEPLADIAPDLVDPVTGLTVGELLVRLAASAKASAVKKPDATSEGSG